MSGGCAAGGAEAADPSHVRDRPAADTRVLARPGRLAILEDALFARRWRLFLFLFTIYVLTASYSSLSIDVGAAEVPAWSLGTQGQLSISSNPYPDVPWFFLHEGAVYSDRFPGAILALVPAYWIAGQLGFESFSVVPGAITAALISAAAVIVLQEVYGHTLAGTRSVRVATLFTAFGTGAWSVCADAPWSHTVDFLLLSLALWALARERILLAGLAFGGVVLTRPHWAIALAIAGLALGWMQRSVPATLKVAVGMLPGVVLLIAYNGLVFGRWGPTNGHELSGSIGADLGGFPLNLLGAVFSPTRGLIVFYPIVLVCMISLPRVLPTATPWQKAAALGAVSGLSLQLLLNRYSGGDWFFGPRLWIEPLVLLAPVLALAARRYCDDHPGSSIVPVMLWAGVLIHATGAVTGPY